MVPTSERVSWKDVLSAHCTVQTARQTAAAVVGNHSLVSGEEVMRIVMLYVVNGICDRIHNSPAHWQRWQLVK